MRLTEEQQEEFLERALEGFLLSDILIFMKMKGIIECRHVDDLSDTDVEDQPDDHPNEEATEAEVSEGL